MGKEVDEDMSDLEDDMSEVEKEEENPADGAARKREHDSDDSDSNDVYGCECFFTLWFCIPRFFDYKTPFFFLL